MSFDRYRDIKDALLLPDLDDNCNPVAQTAEERNEAITLALQLSLDWCDTCGHYVASRSHRCEGDNLVIWP